jgi:predicted ABC-type transport system involved in lysophospholipase L1 biosynthesis ATPase subunit
MPLNMNRSGSMGIIIEAINLCKTYKMGEISIEVLRGVNFAVNQGEYVSLMGPSGSGKSTLLYLLGGLDKPTSGGIKLKGRELALMKDKEESEMRRREIGFYENIIQQLANYIYQIAKTFFYCHSQIIDDYIFLYQRNHIYSGNS